MLVRDEYMPISRRWDDWLGLLVAALETAATDDGVTRCAPMSCVKARDTVLSHLSRPAGARPLYSPAICNRGRLPRSMPRSRASSCMM